MNRGGRWHFEAVLAADGYTLIVRRRLDIPLRSFPLVGPHGLPVSRPVGTYARLKGGARRGESLSLNLPVECQRILSYPQATSSVIYVRRVLLQIGFYGGDLSAAIRSILADAERVSEDYFGDLVPVPQIGRIDTQSLWQLNNLNKMLGDATDQVVMPYAPLPLLNARLFEICVDGTRISYREATDSTELPVGIARWDPHEVLGAELVNRVAALPKCGECGCVYESPIERDHEGSTQSGSLRWCGESGAFFLGCGRRWW